MGVKGPPYIRHKYETIDYILTLNNWKNTIKNAYIKTGKAIDMYLDVYPELRGYGGMCLPKDTKALASLIKKLDLPFSLLDVVTEDNSKVKKTVFNGMREN